jgi:hypothetical protein
VSIYIPFSPAEKLTVAVMHGYGASCWPMMEDDANSAQAKSMSGSEYRVFHSGVRLFCD